MPRCGIVILAAGGSSRLGFAKQLVQFDSASLLRRIASEAIASACKPAVVVLGARADEIQPELNGLPAVVTVNEHWETGMGSSIRRGVAAMLAADPDVEAILIALCDQPRITSAIFDRLRSAYFTAAAAAPPALICAAEYGETIGTPAVFSPALFAELLALPDSAGGRAVIHRHLHQLHRVPVPEAEMDLDTPDDLARWHASRKG